MNPMETDRTHDHLARLCDLLLREREAAKALDLDSMNRIMAEKEELLQILAHARALAPDDRELAARIRHENRRNAYLFKATLDWIRQTMEFFGKRTVPATYSANAGAIGATVGGRLLSGRI